MATRYFKRSRLRTVKTVLLGLGDHLFRSKPVSPYRELTDLAKVSGGKSVSAVNRITAEQLKGYGTIAGTRRTEKIRG